MNQAYKLIDKRIGIFLLQILGQLQLYGHASLAVTEIPDTFAQNGIHYRSDFIVSAPDGIKVSHNTQSSIPR